MQSVLQLHSVGTAASVLQVTAWSHPSPRYSLLLNGLCRFRLEEMRSELPFPTGRVTQLDYTPETGARHMHLAHLVTCTVLCMYMYMYIDMRMASFA